MPCPLCGRWVETVYWVSRAWDGPRQQWGQRWFCETCGPFVEILQYLKDFEEASQADRYLQRDLVGFLDDLKIRYPKPDPQDSDYLETPVVGPPLAYDTTTRGVDPLSLAEGALSTQSNNPALFVEGGATSSGAVFVPEDGSVTAEAGPDLSTVHDGADSGYRTQATTSQEQPAPVVTGPEILRVYPQPGEVEWHVIFTRIELGCTEKARTLISEKPNESGAYLITKHRVILWDPDLDSLVGWTVVKTSLIKTQ